MTSTTTAVSGWTDWATRPGGLVRLPRPVMPEAGSVLVVAPHMDDEVIGVGGTLLRHIGEAAASVSVIFATDGRAGRTGSAGDALARHRREEAEAVASLLGVSRLDFVDGPDGSLQADEPIVAALHAGVERTRPDIVYVPWMFDAHRDHAATCEATARALAGIDGLDPIVRAYEVWSPLVENVVVSIDGYVNRKLAALQLYRSQFVSHEPDRMIALNRHRSLLCDGARHAEAFAEWSCAAFVAATAHAFGVQISLAGGAETRR